MRFCARCGKRFWSRTNTDLCDACAPPSTGQPWPPPIPDLPQKGEDTITCEVYELIQAVWPDGVRSPGIFRRWRKGG